MAAPATALPALGPSSAAAEVYRAIIARSTEAIAVIDTDGFYLEQNGAHRELIPAAAAGEWCVRVPAAPPIRGRP